MRRHLIAAAAVAVALFAVPATASAWAPSGTATIHPGVMTFTEGAQCTANFVLTNGADVFIGQAAHCAGTGGATDTNGCEAGSLPLGTAVEVDGASRPGTLAYSSWLTMQASGESDDEACQYNDWALVRLDPADHAKVNPSVPFWGGPNGTGTASTGQKVYTYGNSSLRFGVTTLRPKTGNVTTVTPGGWSYQVYTASPGIPGDSGSAFLNSTGKALGTLSTLAAAPQPGSNGVSSFVRELEYARSHGWSGLTLALGTDPFSPVI